MNNNLHQATAAAASWWIWLLLGHEYLSIFVNLKQISFFLTGIYRIFPEEQACQWDSHHVSLTVSLPDLFVCLVIFGDDADDDGGGGGGDDDVLQAFQRQVAYPLTDGTPYGLDLCFDIAGVTNPTVPDMTFHFQGGANFLLLPENLFAIVDALDSVMCMAMAGSEGFSIIGNIQQQDHLVIYDRVAQRIGFANANC